ncbi:hypothetical protein JR316_0012092 [Psilocybe cubensis]|nr:hypothetical protein JR316_0012092 [Psilocybe cubensis]KAH9474993.1 hypothetical protein JR316_0012092 [Psilocybe cubensis]
MNGLPYGPQPNMHQAYSSQPPNLYNSSGWGANTLNGGGNPGISGNQPRIVNTNRNPNGPSPYHDPTSFAPNANPVIPNGFSSLGFPATGGAAAVAKGNSYVGGGFQLGEGYGGTQHAPPFAQTQGQRPVENGDNNDTSGRNRSRSAPRSYPNPSTNHAQVLNHDHQHLQTVLYNSPYSTTHTGNAVSENEPPVIPIPNPTGQGFMLMHQQQQRREETVRSGSRGREANRREEEREARDSDLPPIPPAYAITGPHPGWASAWADPNGPFATAVRSKLGERATDTQPPIQHPQQSQQPQPQPQPQSQPLHQQPQLPPPPQGRPPAQHHAYMSHTQSQLFVPQGPVQPILPPVHGSTAQKPALSTGTQPPPAHNVTEMTREMLIPVLDRFSELLVDYFDFSEQASDSPGLDGLGSNPRRPRKLRLVAHGGACMLLHPVFHALSLEMPLVGAPMPNMAAASGGEVSSLDALMQQQQSLQNMKMENLARRTSTRDVDVIMRAFADDYSGVRAPERVLQAAATVAYRSQPPGYSGYSAYGTPAPNSMDQADDADPDSPKRAAQLDAIGRLKACIRRTARHFPGLGLDWMNADADVALPLGADPQTHQTFDPIHKSAVTPHNINQYSVYISPNGRLQLVSVTPAWSIALKIARWGRRDFADVGILLRSATTISGIRWTPGMLQAVLERDCWAMGYSRWDESRTKEFKDRVACAVRMVEGWGTGTTAGQSQGQSQMNGYGYGSGHGHVTGGNELGLYIQGHQTAQPPLQRVPAAVAPQQQQLPPQQRDDREWERDEVRAARMASAEERRERSRARRNSTYGSRSRSKSRARSQSTGPHEMFIPPDDDDDDDYPHEYRYEYPSGERGRGQPRHISRSIPVGSGGGGQVSVSNATAVAPFHRHAPQHIAQATGTHGPRLWRRRSTSRPRNTERDRKARQRDKQRRMDQQRRQEERSGWAMPPIIPFDTDDESGSDDSGDDTDDTDDEGDKENRDRESAWRQANIYGPGKKRPPALDIPPPLTNEQALQQSHGEQHPAYAQQLQPNPYQRQLSRTQSHPHLLEATQRSIPTPYPTPQPEAATLQVPPNANAAQLAQYQFEQQMRSLQRERQYEQSVKDTMNRIAKRIVTRGSTMP